MFLFSGLGFRACMRLHVYCMRTHTRSMHMHTIGLFPCFIYVICFCPELVPMLISLYFHALLCLFVSFFDASRVLICLFTMNMHMNMNMH